MDKRIIIVAAAVLVLIAGVVLFLTLGNNDSGTAVMDETQKVKENTMILARDYLEKGDFQRALDLLDGLLIKDASDEEVRKLRDEVFSARKLAEQEEKQASDQKQNDLVETLEDLGESISKNTSVNNNTIIPQKSAEQAAAEAAAEQKRLEEQMRALEEQKRLAERAQKGGGSPSCSSLRG